MRLTFEPQFDECICDMFILDRIKMNHYTNLHLHSSDEFDSFSINLIFVIHDETTKSFVVALESERHSGLVNNTSRDDTNTINITELRVLFFIVVASLSGHETTECASKVRFE